MEVQFFYSTGFRKAPRVFKNATSQIGVIYSSKQV